MKTKLQKFEMQTLLRSSIKEHPKNPRQITASAKKKMKAKMQEVGLLQPIIVNELTGYVLGGHQRLAVMDSCERYANGKNDYALDVAVVNVSEKEELEMLVFLNNPSAQGSWDVDMLAQFNQELGLDFGNMGFDKIDVDLLFDGDSRFSEVFADVPAVEETKNTLAEIKEHRKESTERLKEKNNANIYFVVVCKDEDEKKACLNALHIPKFEQYVSGDAVLQAVNHG